MVHFEIMLMEKDVVGVKIKHRFLTSITTLVGQENRRSKTGRLDRSLMVRQVDKIMAVCTKCEDFCIMVTHEEVKIRWTGRFLQ